MEINCDDCSCTKRHRYSLPCLHDLLPYLLDQRPIPLNLIHPRWWIRGPKITKEYCPSHGTEQNLIISPRKFDLYKRLHTLMDKRQKLESDQARASFDRYLEQATTGLDQVADNLQKFEAIPLQMPIPNPRRTLKKKKPTLNVRGLTANEIAEATAKAHQQKASQMVRDAMIIAEREQKFEELETQDEIVVAPKLLVARSPTPQPFPSPTLPEPTDLLPFASTAPPPTTEATASRTRGKKRDYRDLSGLPTAKRR